MSKKKEKSKFIIYLEYYPFCLLYGILYCLPLKVGYSISCFLFRLLLLLDKKHYNRSVQHLIHAGIAQDQAQAKKLTIASFMEFAKLLVEVVKVKQLYHSSKIKLTGSKTAIDLAFSQEHDNQNIIITTAHYGNWEVAGTACAEITRIPLTSFMRNFDNPLIGKLILNHRASSIHNLVDKHEGIRPILKALNQKRTITVLIDQHASTNEGVVCEFFGHPACIHMTPALLHLKTGIPIVPEITRRLPGGTFDFEFIVTDPIIYKPTGNKEHDVKVVTQMCISALEKMIRKDPVQWMWSPRHWLDIDRSHMEEYRNWKPDPELSAIAKSILESQDDA